MVQIVEGTPSKSNRFFSGLVGGLEETLPNTLERLIEKRQQNQERGMEDTALKRLGIDIEGVRDPHARQALIQSGAKKVQDAEQKELENRDYEAVKGAWGEKFANIWRALGQGERTALTTAAIDSGLRKEDVEDIFRLQKEKGDPIESQEMTPERTPQVDQRGEIPKEYKWPDYSKRPPGYTPKEWTDEKKLWRKENSPIFEEAKTRLKNNERDALGIKTLTNLNNTRKVGEGFERALINPSTGEFYGLAQLANVVGEDAQAWVKEIARFGNRAKDAFGSRVTNFDLQQYMKQFPGLLNTFEGRQRILRMMDINNRLDHLYDSALKQVYQKKGLGGIPQEEADKLAQEFIEDETERLREEYINLDTMNQQSTSPQGAGQQGQRPSLEEIFK